MTIAHVVPLRRFDPAHDWFDYRVPEKLSVKPGDLVTIPFLRQSLSGIVWELSNQTQTTRLRSIQALNRPEPVMSPWQMRSLAIVAREGFVSLGHLLVSAIPNFPQRDRTPVQSIDAGRLPVQPAGNFPSTRTWWYRDRAEAVSWIVAWLAQPGGIRIVIVPSIADGEALSAAAERSGLSGPCISGQTTPAAYRRVYEQVRRGQLTRVIGTGRVCLLPYAESPQVLIDQEEHPAHKLTERHPRLDNRWLVHRFFDQPLASSPAPSLSWFIREQPPPPAGHPPRRIASLDRPGHQPWISPELASLLDGRQRLLLILPRGESGRSLRCRTCGLGVACQRCGQRLRWQSRAAGWITCQACGFDQPEGQQCPRCGSLTWSLQGLSIERLQTILVRDWPNRQLSSSRPPLTGTDTWLGTYQSYRWLLPQRQPDVIVVVSGDRLRAWSDFAADERAWQYLARLQAAAPQVPVVLQTDAPNEDFWQRWQAADETAWYQHELVVRKQLKTPPWIDQWIIRYQGTGAEAAVQRLRRWLQAHAPDVSLEALPPAKSARAGLPRWLLSAPDGQQLGARLPGRELFPPPWQVDPWVTSWLD